MDDLMTDIDRRPVKLQGALNRIDGTHHAGAKAARRAKDDLEFGLLNGRHAKSLAIAQYHQDTGAGIVVYFTVPALLRQKGNYQPVYKGLASTG
jgi:hypothetical protein